MNVKLKKTADNNINKSKLNE